MATHDYIIANASGAAVRADLNNALAAIVSNNSNATAPATTYAYQWWADTTANQLKLRNAANDDWIVIQELDGTMLMEDGTAAAPGLAFADDVDTGLFRPAANKLGVATNGVERVEFGTTEVVFNDSGANVDFRVEGDAEANLLFVDAGNDRVGISTNSPNTELEVEGDILAGTNSSAGQISAPNHLGTATNANIQVNSSTNNNPSISLNHARSNSLGSPYFAFNKAHGDFTTPTIVSDSADIGSLVFNGFDGTNYIRAAQIGGEVDGTPGTNDMPGRLVFSTTADGASSPSERMRIDSSGNVGIGTSSPDVKLHIDEATGSANDTPEVKISSFRPTIRLDDKSSSANSAEICGDNALIFRCSVPVNDDTALTEHMRITAAGNVGIGTSTPQELLTLGSTTESDQRLSLFSFSSSDNDAYGSIEFRAGSSAGNINSKISSLRSGGSSGGALAFFTRTHGDGVNTDGGIERMRIDPSGKVGIGTDSPTRDLTIRGTGESLLFDLNTANANEYASIAWQGTDVSLDEGDMSAEIRGYRVGTGAIGALAFHTRGTSNTSVERMRITAAGDVLVAKTDEDTANIGCELRANGFGGFTRSNNVPLLSNRTGNDGSLVHLRQDNVTEGTITVSGTTVSYNGGHLSRWSQLAGNAARTEILRGSVLSNLDEMCEWAYEAKDAVLYTEEDDLPEGVSVGDVKEPAVAAGTEDNEQLNRMKVSDVEGDVNVAGVFQCWDDDDDTYTNDFYCAMTGDFVIRIAQGTTVARGDLLMSAGDGTAKPQEDDIVRSKTIAKVTSTTVSTTYADGSYCVPCVLMAC